MHRIDDNDLAHALRLGLAPVAWAPCPRSEDGAINPQVTRLALADGQWADVVHVKPVYYETPKGHWRPLSEVCSHHGNRQIAIRPDRVAWVHPRFLLWLMKRQRLLGAELAFWAPGYSGVQPADLAFAATLTAYPDPDPETTTVDGTVLYSSNPTWATVRGASTGTSASDNGTNNSIRTGSAFDCYRAFCLFATSALTAAATITTATASIFPLTKTNSDNDGDDWINVLQSSPASNTALATTDYPNVGDALTNPTEGSTRADISGITTGAYLDFALNATGIGWVSKTGVTKLGYREGHDCIDSAPAGANQLLIRNAESLGTSNDPKLAVTYTVPAGLLGDPLRAFQHMIMR